MDRVDIDETKESLADLVARVEGGETVVIMRGAAVIARIEPAKRTYARKEPIDFERLKRVRDSLPYQDEPAGEFIRRLRDEARY